MATSPADSKCLSLKEFKGSKEEKIVQQIFQVITTDPNFVRFINLVIHKCNAEDGTCFSDAYITLQATYECMRREKTDFVTERPKCEAVEMKDMLKIRILEEFQKGGVDAIENYHQPGVSQSFLVLLIFLREMKSHEIAIGNLIDTNPSTSTKETQIMAGLAHHLFSQLVPSNKYEVDEYANQLPKTCGCGCDSNICAGDTSLGSPGTWHGRVDIMVNHTVAVAIVKEPTENDDEDDTDEEEEPQEKQRKVETDTNCDIYMEVEGNRRHDSVLLDLKVLKQILALAVTNGFAQVNMNRSTLSHFLIPTFGATSDHVSICLYDPENDCLLHIDEELNLWGDFAHKLDPETIIIIWLFLNFTTFTKKELASATNLKKSGLHKDLKEDLQYYRETKAKAKFVLQTPVRPWKKATIQVKHPNTKL